MNLLEVTRHNIEGGGRLAPGQRVVVAVSGGPDSVCLLHVLLRLRPTLKVDLHVAHLNHGLRGPEAGDDAAFVASLAAEWGIEATIEQADVRAYQRAHRLSLEAAARHVRYDFLKRVAERIGAQAVALAHTADDQVETILMHLLRGAGLTGLRGMTPVSDRLGSARLIRPFLTVSRQDIEAYLAEQGISYCTDRSNEDESIWRNRLRRQVIPFLETVSPALRRTLLRTASILADDDAYIETQVWRLWEDIVHEGPQAVTVELVRWQELPPALQRRLLRAAWKWVSGCLGDLLWIHVENARSTIAGRAGTCMHLPGQVRLERGYGSFSLLGPKATPAPNLDLPLLPTDGVMRVTIPGCAPFADGGWYVRTTLESPEATTQARPSARLWECFDGDVVGTELILRGWQPGDRMEPLGMAGSRKVHDIMIDAHVPRGLRRRLPMLVAGNRILWVVGVRRSEWGKVTTATQRVLTVEFARADSSC